MKKFKQSSKLAQAIQKVIKRNAIDLDNDQDLQEIINIVQKPKVLKTEADADFLRLALYTINFFKDLETQMGKEHVTSLYQELNYEFMAARSVVFFFGEVGRKFYVILRGTVWILVKKKGLQDEDFEDGQKKKKKMLTRSGTKTFITTNDQQEDDPEWSKLTDQEYIQKKFPEFQKVGEMQTGQSFGEIALHNQMPRTATIVCSNDCHFIVLTRETFKKMLSEYYEIVKQRNLQFLSKVAIFEEWTEAQLNQIYYHFTFQDYKMNEIIYKEEEESTAIYLIKNGEVEISQELEIQIRPPNESESLIKNFTKKRKKNCKYKRHKVALINDGQIFGQEEILKDIRRETRAVCVSEKLSVFILNKQRFLTYCQRGNAVQKIEKFSEQKKTWRVGSEEHVKFFENPPYSQAKLSEDSMKELIQRMLKKDKLKFKLLDNQSQVDNIRKSKNYSSIELLSNSSHHHIAVRNFNKNLSLIQRSIKPSFDINLNQQLIEIDKKKGQDVESKCLTQQPSKKIGRDKKHLLKSLKLPELLNQISKIKIGDGNRSKSFGYSSLNWE